MGDLASILADVRSLANRGAHHAIVARYGALDDTPEEETWNSTELLFEIGRAFGMLGNEDKVERYLLRCAELAPRRAAVFHCAIGWYFQRKKKWTKALRWYDRALASFPTYHLCLFRRGYCLEKLHRPRETVDALSRAREICDKAPTEQRQRGRGVQVQVLAAEPLVRVELARVELAVGRRAAALRHVERALACRREGGFAEGLRLAAELCEQLGRAADARRYLEQLARLAPADAEIAARAAALAAAPGSERPPSPPDPPLPPALAALAHAAVEAPGGERLPAIVDRFFPEKGFGFLRYGDGESIFFHVTQCEEGADGIGPGTRVTFVVGHNAKKGKPQAEVVRRVG